MNLYECLGPAFAEMQLSRAENGFMSLWNEEEPVRMGDGCITACEQVIRSHPEKFYNRIGGIIKVYTGSVLFPLHSACYLAFDSIRWILSQVCFQPEDQTCV